MVKKMAMVALMAMLMPCVRAWAQISSGAQPLNVTNWATAPTDPSATQSVYTQLGDGYSPSAATTNQYATNQGVSAYNQAIAAGKTPAQATQAANSAATQALSFVATNSTQNTVQSYNNLEQAMVETPTYMISGALAGIPTGTLGVSTGMVIGGAIGTAKTLGAMAPAFVNGVNNSQIMASGVNLPSTNAGGSSGPYASTTPYAGTPNAATNSVGASAIGSPLGNAVQATNAAYGVGQAPATTNAPSTTNAAAAGSAPVPTNLSGTGAQPSSGTTAPSSPMPTGKIAAMIDGAGNSAIGTPSIGAMPQLPMNSPQLQPITMPSKFGSMQAPTMQMPTPPPPAIQPTQYTPPTMPSPNMQPHHAVYR